MSTPFIRIPLQTGVTIQQVDTLAWREDWEIQQSIAPTNENPYEVIFTNGEGTEIHYIEDFLLGVNYLLIIGENAATLANHLRNKIPNYSLSEIQTLVEQATTQDDQIKAIYLTAATASSQFDPGIFQLFETILASNQPVVRSAAIMGIGYTEWQHFKPVLETLQKTDPDANVREDAKVMLEGLKRVWGEY